MNTLYNFGGEIMKRIFNWIMFSIGLFMFFFGASCADCECLLIPIVLTFGGMGIMYLNRECIL